MTNKLEEVFKELQDSHVLVDREEYEKLLEKVKLAEIEEEKRELKNGNYYFRLGEIFRITEIREFGLICKTYNTEEDRLRINVVYPADSLFIKNSRNATDEEIKLFKRAEMYHKHGRKLDDLKVGDLIKIGKGIYQMKNETTGFIQSIIEGRHELYLTIEEAQEAHKKIVGE